MAIRDNQAESWPGGSLCILKTWTYLFVYELTFADQFPVLVIERPFRLGRGQANPKSALRVEQLHEFARSFKLAESSPPLYIGVFSPVLVFIPDDEFVLRGNEDARTPRFV